MKNTKRLQDDIAKNVKPRMDKVAREIAEAFSMTIKNECPILANRLQNVDGSAWLIYRDEVARAERMIEPLLAEAVIIQLKKKFKINWQ